MDKQSWLSQRRQCSSLPEEGRTPSDSDPHGRRHSDDCRRRIPTRERCPTVEPKRLIASSYSLDEHSLTAGATASVASLTQSGENDVYLLHGAGNTAELAIR